MGGRGGIRSSERCRPRHLARRDHSSGRQRRDVIWYGMRAASTQGFAGCNKTVADRALQLAVEIARADGAPDRSWYS